VAFNEAVTRVQGTDFPVLTDGSVQAGYPVAVSGSGSAYTVSAGPPTSASTVSFTVTFSEAVTGVDPTDFQLALDYTVGATVTQVTSVSTSVYAVTVSGITGVPGPCGEPRPGTGGQHAVGRGSVGVGR
jgi:hypothetical protein